MFVVYVKYMKVQLKCNFVYYTNGMSTKCTTPRELMIPCLLSFILKNSGYLSTLQTGKIERSNDTIFMNVSTIT